MSVSQDLFRKVVGSFPAGVTVVTAVGQDGLPRGLTSNAFSSVSADPPLLLVCVDKSSQTLPALQAAGAFVVNVLAAGSDAVSNVFASKAPDKFAGLTWRKSTVARGAPILEQDSIAYAECVTYQEVDAGDHVIFIGRVEHGAATEGAPLMYFRRTYAAWPNPELAPAVTGAARTTHQHA